MSVSQVNQVYGILVTGDHIWEFDELIREKRFQVCCVRIVPRIFYLERFALWGSIDYEDASLIPNADQECTTRQKDNLSDILARENLVLT